jgi:excisionase family DNA binding protein
MTDAQAALAAMFAAGEDPSLGAAMAAKFAADATARPAFRPPPMPLDVLTLAEAAEYLRLPESAVSEEASAGRLVGRCVGGEWRFVRDEIVRWLRAPRSTATSPDYSETPEEHEAFLAILQANRDEENRIHGFGRYAPE